MDYQTQPPPQPSRLGRIGKWFGISGAILCGVWVFVIMGLAIANTTVSHVSGGGLGFAMAYITIIPIAFIPIAIVCLLGAVLSGLAWRHKATSDARIGLMLSLAAPGVAVVCYALGFAMLS